MKNIYYPLATAPLDDDYLYEMNHQTSYQHEDDYEEEPIADDEYDPEHPYWLEDDYDPRTDPLRIIHMAEREQKVAV